MSPDVLANDIQQAFLASCGRSISLNEAKEVSHAFMTVRDTARQINLFPRHLMQFVFENKNYYKKSYYPCDVIELRRILENQQITSLSKIILFSKPVIDKVFKSYKCILILDFDPEKINNPHNANEDVFVAGGMTILNKHQLNIKDILRGIILTEKAPSYRVEKIVKETLPSLPVYESFMIPGVDMAKFASDEKYQKFKINLPALQIENEIIVALDEYSAVEEALNKAWAKNPDKKYMKRKPARYDAEYWLRSGFWDSIVDPENAYREASNNTVSITPEERNIFQTILQISNHFNLGTTFRVAGGWVRDRLLGKISDDIDIAMDNLTGAQFYKYAIAYGKKFPDAQIGKSYTVDMNVEKSKHLETVAVEIGGIKIDFVNLRSESYGEDSRVPTVEFGTPEIDAQRRDLTINALFYNINNGQVEDYVGGMQDLASLTLRTPLDPIKTFTDDPLRMLRVLRFNSRYPGSKISPETFNAMASPKAQEAYLKKVAPERAGPEIYKLLAGPQAPSALRALFAVNLDKAIFSVPEIANLLPLNMDQRSKHHMYDLLEHTLQTVESLQKICYQNNIPEKERVLMLFSAIFHDYGKAVPGIGKPKENNPQQYGYHGHEDESAKIAEAIGKRIGFGKDDREFINRIVSQHMEPHRPEWNNKSIGRWLQKLRIPGQEDRLDLWKYVFYHAEADTIAHGGDRTEDLDRKKSHWNQFEEYLNRPQPIVNKPLVDGQILMTMFPSLSPKPGKGGTSFIKEIQQRLLDEQLSGNIHDADQARQFVESIRGEIENKYMQPKTASRIYNLVSFADASSAAGPEGHNEDAISEDSGIMKMIRRHPGEPSMYAVGDRVRTRNSGMSQDQKYGRITKKKLNIIEIQWEGSTKVDKYDLNDVETLSLIERV